MSALNDRYTLENYGDIPIVLVWNFALTDCNPVVAEHEADNSESAVGFEAAARGWTEPADVRWVHCAASADYIVEHFVRYLNMIVERMKAGGY